ncbi:baseplate J/gp47 family protein [Telmatospirillum sp. J64-1]|uniref:baseplate assembly protein n=1 Tax=Telmatospirillum sp. J64-1 TaxID=2502183 RepID=UPI00115F33E1|nr:baseplate J/gp47 family protein [Telmatospirillum sp. J64-1]
MTTFSQIKLDQLPPPDVVEALSYEDILAEMIADLKARGEYTAIMESDPAIKLLEVAAYREMLLRQRVNDAARAVMLATAKGADLDHLAAWPYPVQRQVVDPGDPHAIPPRPPVMESDERFKQRIMLAPESLSVAGPDGAYISHALDASPQVKDVAVESPAPVEVVVTILSIEGKGIPSPELLTVVEAALQGKKVRPLTDRVTVQAAEIVEYDLVARIDLYPGPDAEVVLAASRKQAQAYVQDHHRLGDPHTDSGLKAALTVPGVKRVILDSPQADINPASHQAVWCNSISISLNGGGNG